jgi:hypothetical protein
MGFSYIPVLSCPAPLAKLCPKATNMPGNKRAVSKATAKARPQFFVHPQVALQYQRVHDTQADTLLRIPALQWRGMLSRITPAVAAHLVATGSHLIAPRTP